MTTYDFSATGVKYPLENSPVNVHGDFKKLAESLGNNPYFFNFVNNVDFFTKGKLPTIRELIRFLEVY